MSLDSAVKKMSEGRTWSSEDTGVFSFKVFFGAWLAPSICFTWLRKALTPAAFSEAERIVFAAEGLRLAHDFPFNCGMRDE
jgi:hypothetical protein